MRLELGYFACSLTAAFNNGASTLKPTSHNKRVCSMDTSCVMLIPIPFQYAVSQNRHGAGSKGKQSHLGVHFKDIV